MRKTALILRRTFAPLLSLEGGIGCIAIREENAAAALEVMSRFAVNPKWLVYLPPTMSPSETHSDGGWLEHPDEAFSYFARNGVRNVICEEKHIDPKTNETISVTALERRLEAAI